MGAESQLDGLAHETLTIFEENKGENYEMKDGEAACQASTLEAASNVES